MIHWQLSKKLCSRKYCSYDKACQLENSTIDDKFVNQQVLLFIHQTICVSLKLDEKKKLLGRHNKDLSLKIYWPFTPLRNSCLITFKKMEKQLPDKFCKKAVLKNFIIFTGKHLCLRLFLVQSIAKLFRAPIVENICERLLR